MNLSAKNATHFIFFGWLLLYSSLSYSQNIIAQNYPLLQSVKEINKNTPDTCRINEYVVSTYECPPCPRGAECKPCVGNYVMVADSLPGKNPFRVFVKDPGQFTLNKKYSLLIRLYKTNTEEVYDAAMIEIKVE